MKRMSETERADYDEGCQALKECSRAVHRLAGGNAQLSDIARTLTVLAARFERLSPESSEVAK